jgi:uncharacterized protein
MAHVQVVADDVELDSPTFVEGLPGAGLVGKIAADHLVDTFEMTHFGDLHCDGLPRVAVYRPERTSVLAPVRLYADEEHDLVVLQSDVPVSPTSAGEFVTCLTSWIEEHGASPIFLSGLPVEEKEGVPELYGIATGDAESRIEDAGIVPPREGGLVSGPTGALLAHANERALDAVGLVVETQAQFPDPEAARVILEGGIEPLTGIDVSTDELVDQAEEIQEARERLAKRLQEADDESSQAQPIRGFQ